MGGGISVGDDCNALLRACVFRGNSATTGGGIAFSNSRGRVIECTFAGNSAENGGGASATNTARPEFEECIFDANSAAIGGGAFGEWGFPTFLRCLFRDNVATDAGGGIGARILAEMELVECTLDGNRAGKSGGGTGLFGGSSVALTSCTLHANRAPSGGGIAVYSAATAYCDRSIVAGTLEGGAVRCDGGDVALGCCDLYDNAGGDYTGCIAGLEEVAGNLSADPLFCDPAAGDFSVRGDSPCAPEFNPSCGLVGAHPVGCAAMEVAVGSPAAVRILVVSPNPFSSALSLRIAPGEAGAKSKADVFDAAGRLVRRLRVPRSGGTIPWDGTDSFGREVPAGVYYVRVLGAEGAGAGAVRAEASVVRLR